MKKYRVIYLDAFTSEPFTGNPCAVLPEADVLTVWSNNHAAETVIWQHSCKRRADEMFEAGEK